MPDTANAEALRERLKAIPLLTELTDESSEILDFECRLLAGDATAVPEGHCARPSYLQLESYREGAVIHHQGDLCVGFCVILKGSVLATRSHPREGTQLLNTFKAEDWFGETTALSEMPSFTSHKAGQDCEILRFDNRLFQKIYLGEEDEPFQEKIDHAYSTRSLNLHLRSSPLFADADPSLVESLRKECRFESYENGDEIAAQGDDVEAFYLVRSGGIECWRPKEDGTKQVLSYYMANSSFGEQAACAKEGVWPGTLTARACKDPSTPLKVFVVKIPVASFRRARELNPRALQNLTYVANRLLTNDDDEVARAATEPLALNEVELMVDGQSFKGGEALVIEQHKCIRCNMCVESCASVHRDGIPRISKIGAKIQTDEVLISACYHCDIPSCMSACAYGAIRRDAKGTVRFVLESCVGCTNCVDACPYDVIKMTDLAGHQDAHKQRPPGVLGSLIGLLLGRPPQGAGAAGCGAQTSLSQYVINIGEDEDERSAEVNGKAIKCDLCAGLPFEACVYNCPTNAIERHRPESMFVKR